MKNTYIKTPRFLTVKIQEVFESKEKATIAGYTEPTHYLGTFDVLGKTIGTNQMIFAVVEK